MTQGVDIDIVMVRHIVSNLPAATLQRIVDRLAVMVKLLADMFVAVSL